MATKVT